MHLLEGKVNGCKGNESIRVIVGKVFLEVLYRCVDIGEGEFQRPNARTWILCWIDGIIVSKLGGDRLDEQSNL
jgi:hypothetical protein